MHDIQPLKRSSGSVHLVVRFAAFNSGFSIVGPNSRDPSPFLDLAMVLHTVLLSTFAQLWLALPAYMARNFVKAEFKLKPHPSAISLFWQASYIILGSSQSAG